MAWDESGTKREVESLKKRFPKRGIDPTIPEGIRAALREKEQDALTPSSKYASGGQASAPATKTPPMPTPIAPPTPTIKQAPTPIAAPTPGAQSAGRDPAPPTVRRLPPSASQRGAGVTRQYAKGGVTRADGCVSKGHTKGKMR